MTRAFLMLQVGSESRLVRLDRLFDQEKSVLFGMVEDGMFLMVSISSVRKSWR